MRLPPIRGLTKAQRDVYLYAPTDRHILVSGPPGTGKTLIACMRAIELRRQERPYVLGMYNRVLARYSSNVEGGDALQSTTVLKWFGAWWQTCGLPPHPASRSVVMSPYEDRDAVRAAGARYDRQAWRPKTAGQRGGPGAWVVDGAVLEAHPERFARWPLVPEVPRDEAGNFDWKAIADHLIFNDESLTDSSLNLGTLIIDEGQDFPPDFYRTLHAIGSVARSRGKAVEYPVRCMVLADENQQITDQNSTLNEIAAALKIGDGARYVLLDNFRNSREIALLARSFFNDVGVLPNLPEQYRGMPVMARLDSLDEVVSRIRTWVANNPRKETAVLVFEDGLRDRLVEVLGVALGQVRRGSVTVQTYSAATSRQNPAAALVFDAPDVVTVLNVQSCKGLEFDAVFVVNPSRAQIGLYGPGRFRMQMFVAVSRARDAVGILDAGPAGQHPWLAEMPGDNVLERESAGRGRAVPAKSASAGAAPAAPVAPPARSKALRDWADEAMAIATRFDLPVEDNRSVGGPLWVYAGPELEEHFDPLNMKYSERRGGWWRK